MYLVCVILITCFEKGFLLDGEFSIEYGIFGVGIKTWKTNCVIKSAWKELLLKYLKI